VFICEGLLYLVKNKGEKVKNNEITESHLLYNVYCLRFIELFMVSIYLIIILRNDMGIRFDRRK